VRRASGRIGAAAGAGRLDPPRVGGPVGGLSHAQIPCTACTPR